MGKTLRIFLLLAAVALVNHLFFGISQATAEEVSARDGVTAYYFHGTFRCATCRKLEQYSKETIESDFKEALTSGKLTFKTVNVEDKGNEHYVNEYQLYTKSLVLSLTKGGNEVRAKNLEKIWEYVGNKQRFQDYVRDEVAAFLKEN